MSRDENIDKTIENKEIDICEKRLDSLARRLYPASKEYYESEEGRQTFEKWGNKQKEEK